MIDVYSARWNEKHKLLSLLWKLQGDLVADVVPTFGTPGLFAQWLFNGKKPFTYRMHAMIISGLYIFFTPFWMVKNVC